MGGGGSRRPTDTIDNQRVGGGGGYNQRDIPSKYDYNKPPSSRGSKPSHMNNGGHHNYEEHK
jgi:hypothetical protein